MFLAVASREQRGIKVSRVLIVLFLIFCLFSALSAEAWDFEAVFSTFWDSYTKESTVYSTQEYRVTYKLAGKASIFLYPDFSPYAYKKDKFMDLYVYDSNGTLIAQDRNGPNSSGHVTWTVQRNSTYKIILDITNKARVRATKYKIMFSLD